MMTDKFNIYPCNIVPRILIILILLSTRTAAISDHNSLIPSSPMSSAPNVTDLNCLGCEYDYQCTLGEIQKAKCSVKDLSECRWYKEKSYSLNYTCAYCYQFPEDHYVCTPSLVCETNSKYLAECTMKPDVLCLGNRTFHRYRSCNIAAGYRWSTALLLSITVGGFGIDRFYLGYWQEGIGKLFSFGGFGVWTLVDIILIATGYLKPADGSRYISDVQFTR